MLDQFINSHDTIQRLRSGTLGTHLDSFAEHLARCGYAPATARAKLTLLGQLDQWLVRRRRGPGELDDDLVRKFVDGRARLGSVRRGEPAAGQQFLRHLRSHNVIPSPAPVVDETPLGQLQIGGLASVFGVGVALGTSGIALMALAGFAPVRAPRLRGL